VVDEVVLEQVFFESFGLPLLVLFHKCCNNLAPTLYDLGN
jgi:hypothetical protein